LNNTGYITVTVYSKLTWLDHLFRSSNLLVHFIYMYSTLIRKNVVKVHKKSAIHLVCNTCMYIIFFNYQSIIIGLDHACQKTFTISPWREYLKVNPSLPFGTFSCHLISLELHKRVTILVVEVLPTSTIPLWCGWWSNLASQALLGREARVESLACEVDDDPYLPKWNNNLILWK
jgi:hypothetical protein